MPFSLLLLLRTYMLHALVLYLAADFPTYAQEGTGRTWLSNGCSRVFYFLVFSFNCRSPMQRAIKTVILLCRYFILILQYSIQQRRQEGTILHPACNKPSKQVKESMEKGRSAGQGGGTRRGLISCE